MSEHEHELTNEAGVSPADDAGVDQPADAPAPAVIDDEPAPATEDDVDQEREPHPHSPGYGVTRKFPVPQAEERDQ